jgi:PKD repeat protein
MRKFYAQIFIVLGVFAYGMLGADFKVNAQTTITEWNFDNADLVPSVGTGTAVEVGGTTSTFAGGLGSAKGWNTTNYPAQGTGSGTAGAEFDVSTVGYQDITISWDQRHSGTSANRIRLQYTTNGTTWVDFVATATNATNINNTTTTTADFDAGRYIGNAKDTWFNRSANLASITAANNNASFKIRVVTEFESGSNYGPANPAAGSSYGVAGTLRFDNVKIMGNTFAAGAPTVTTTAISNITYNSATSGGNVTSDGGSAVTARGVCWSTSMNPTTADAHTTEAGTTGAYTSQMTGLSYSTLYYVRAYATNVHGTSYGNEITFTTAIPPFPPVADFSASSTTIVAGQSIDFTDLSTNIPTSWNWSLMGGTPYSSTVQNPQDIQYTVAGTYDVCLTATNAYGSNTLCKTGFITVVEPVNAQVVITEIMYNSPESGTDSLEYIEFYNNGTAAVNMEGYTTTGVDFTFPAMTINPGAYTVLAVNAAAMQRTFGVSALQWTSGALSNSGEAITLKDNFGILVDSVMYDDVAPWDTLADGWGHSLVLCDPNLDNNLGENWSAATTFVTVNAANDSIWGNPGAGCPSIVLPVAAFTSNVTEIGINGSVAFQDQSTGGTITAWEWTFEGGTPATSTEQNPTIVYSTLGTYDVTLKVTNADGDNTVVKTDYINVVVNPGIGDVDGSKVVVSPNPSNGIFNIAYNGNATSLKVYSLRGSLLLQLKNTEINNRLDLSGFNKGMYILEIELSNGTKLNNRLIVK